MLWTNAHHEIHHLARLEDELDCHANATGYTIAKIVDIDMENKVTGRRTLMSNQLCFHRAHIAPLVNDFVSGFRECQPLLHTRLLLIQTKPRASGLMNSLVGILLGHILSIELDMSLAEVCSTLRFASPAMIAPLCLPRISLTASTIGAGLNGLGPPDILCNRIGPRIVKGKQVEHGKYCVTDMHPHRLRK